MPRKLLRSLSAALFLSMTAVSLAAGEASDADKNGSWENISDAFFKKLDVYDITPSYLRRCVGMAVTPTGEIFVMTSKGHGICVSKDRGATWAEVPDNKITGRWETGFDFSIAYPYDGRLAFFCTDGTGGISLDDGNTWRPFTKLLRSFEFADIDWSTKDPQKIFGVLHEPYFTVLSADGGRSWQQLYKDTEAVKDAQKKVMSYCIGVVDANNLVRYVPDQDAITLSADGGQTWNEVAKYKVLGRRPVHYGKNIYWTTADGVIASDNGKDWKLLGAAPDPEATFGPYFGRSESELMVVGKKGFFISRDGGKSWTNVAPFFLVPDGFAKRFEKTGKFLFFGWDSAEDVIYASALGGSCFRLKLKP